MEFSTENAALLSLCWVAYFSIHSGLASLSAKGFVVRRWARFMPYYRLAFVSISVALLIAIILFSSSLDAPSLWAWKGGLFWIANGLAALAALGIVWTATSYDLAEHFGLRQIWESRRAVEDQETFKLSPIHRFVRHPWYFFLLVIIWTRDVDGARLVAYIAISVYLIVGSGLEDRKLISYYGDTYRRYRRRVHGLFPLPWRFLSREEAADLVQSYEGSRALAIDGGSAR